MNSFLIAFNQDFIPIIAQTSLIKVLNDIHLNNGSDKVFFLVLWNFCAAFDPVDQTVILHRLENWVGLSRIVLGWFKSHLHDTK